MDLEIPELIPMDDYDARQARLESSMRWLLSKAYEGSIPLDYQEFFFSLGLSSVLACRLTSSELYWMATSAIFPEVKGQTQQGHAPLIRFLVRRGVYLADVNGVEVNEKLLQRTSPVHLMAHITLLEGLMTAYINSTLTPEKVVPAVRKFASFSASSELPTNAEDTAMFWVNKTCASLCHHLRELNPSVCPESLTVNDIKDVNDGRCLAAVISFYCPQELPLSAVELGDSLAIADSLYNLQLLYNFCRSHLNASLLTLTVMDLFYTPDTLHLNILAFYADLFHCLEVERASCVRDTGLPLNLGTNATQPKLHVLPSPPVNRVVIPQISDPTKRSFLHSVSTSHSRPQSSTVNGTRRPLLPRRHSDVRSAGGGNSDADQPLTEAWEPSSGVHASSSKGSVIVNASSGNSLLSNVMIDDSIDLNLLDSSYQSCDDEVGSLLQTLKEKISSKAVNRKRAFNAPRSLGPLQCSVVGGGELCNFASGNLPPDPSLPAQLGSSKEKLNSHSKKCEYNKRRGGGGQKKREAATADDSDCERSESEGEASRSSSSSSTPIDEYKTPSVESVENDGNETGSKEIAPENNGFAFASSEIEPGNENDPKQLCRSRPGGQSYVVRGRPTVLDDALAVGLPVVASGGPLGIPGGFTSGSGCAADGGFDQELHKLQVDSRGKEFSGRNGGRGYFVPLGTDAVQLHGGAKKPPDKGVVPRESHLAENGSRTSFAQIKKQKEAGEISKGSRDLGSIPEGSAGSRAPAGVPLLARPRKKTATFGVLPNQTTWVQESAQRVSEKAAASTGEDSAEPMPSELIGLRLKLEENRRLIESRKRLTERQWHQQRQQMGKEAFIQVITKNKNGVDLSGDDKSFATTEASNTVHHKVPMKSDEGKTKAGTLPKRQSPNLKVIQELDVTSHSNLNQAVAQSSDDQAESLPKVDTENQVLVVDSDSALQVIGSVSKEAVSDESNASEPQRSLHSGADPDEQTPYDASLDRINSSITELHGEIQRLSRQQDQINSLVRSEVGQGTRGGANVSAREPQSSRGATTTTPTKDEFPVRQFPSARKAAVGAGPLPMGAQNFLCTEIALHQSRPSTAPYSVPSYPSAGMPFPSRYHPTPSVPLSSSQYQPYATVPPVTMPAERMYSQLEPGHQYVALGSQFHPSSGVYPVVPGMYPISVPTSYGHYQGSVPHQQYPHLQNLSTLMRHPEFPPGLPPHEMPFTEFLQPLPHASPLSFQSPVSWTGSQPIHGVAATETQSPYVQIQATDIVTGQDFVPSEGSDALKIPGSVHLPSSVQDLGDAGQTDVPPQTGGFFVNLGDSPTPTRQKPNLKARHKSKLKGSGCDVLVLDPVMSASASLAVAEPPLYPGDPAPDDAVSDAKKVLPGNSETSPLVFVIGQSTENEDDCLEMERRKQRLLCEMQIKRQEEQELRREKLQREQERKREQQRMKQEMTEQKRAEERARREAIFQSYLQKKKEKEMSEESPSKPVPPVIRRQRSAQQRGARPKSQPALPAEMTPTKAASGIVGHSSHDNLTTDGAIAKTPASNFLRNNGKVNSAQIEVPLAFGGLTHRRPPTPDQNTPTAAQPTSDGSESSGSQMADNYTGPKLFVKPSQKSNRHIVINAISHCCLAGSVNKDVKDKVLEEIARSDAKHFIILFRDAAMQYRGLYTYNPDQEEVLRIHGVGPKQLTDKFMEKFYKYNSGSKKFSEITSTKHLTATIDAVAVLSTVWQKARPAAPSKKPL